METEHDLGLGLERLQRYQQDPALANVVQSAQTIILRGLALHLRQQSRAWAFSLLFWGQIQILLSLTNTYSPPAAGISK